MELGHMILQGKLKSDLLVIYEMLFFFQDISLETLTKPNYLSAVKYISTVRYIIILNSSIALICFCIQYKLSLIVQYYVQQSA